MGFLPVCKEDMKQRGWDQLDFVYISGDAYVDHPSFGHAIITRKLENLGYKVGIIAQPNWKDIQEFKKLGQPRLGFLISSGNVDSMVNHFSVGKRRRRDDRYSPGGVSGKRPDRAVVVYATKVREAYKDTAVIIGGIEASLRRFAHYDYWDNKVRRSILLDAKADLLIYGMGEKPIAQIAEALDSGIAAKDISWIPGTVCRKNEIDDEDTILLPSHDEILSSKEKFAQSFALQYQNSESVNGRPLAEQYDQRLFVVQNPPAELLTQWEMDEVYDLPYERNYHPMYEALGGVPAISEVKFSLTSSRGCFGGCAFCALTYHQGRIVQSRSKESLVKEGEILARMPDFKGYINDVGGPTANFRGPACKVQSGTGTCKNKSCLFPEKCSQMKVNHQDYLEVLRSVRNIKGVKKVFIRSGIRFDYAIYDKDPTFMEELCKHHVSGTLKVAPEHISKNVLKHMRKPPKEVYEAFCEKYKKINEKLGLKQYIIPYFISSHPGSTLEDAVELACYLKQHGFVPDQVQDFYPTPGTLATCAYYTKMDPFTKEKVYIPDSEEEKRLQRALLHFNKPENYELVYKALQKTGRHDLIGFGPDKLIRPRNTRRKEDGAIKGSAKDSGRQQNGIRGVKKIKG